MCVAQFTMTRTRSAAKRQKIATVESALANIDVLSQLAAFLEANDLCQVKAMCRALGSANDGAAFNGLSMTEEAARRVFESAASDEEKAVLPRYDGEGWIELYHHLLMLRARLTFDQLVGRYAAYRGGDAASVQGMIINGLYDDSQAICGNHIMRAGKHWTTFKSSSSFKWNQSVGVIRPLPGWDKRGLDSFTPTSPEFHEDLQHERTDRWEGDVHCCCLDMRSGNCYWSDWEGLSSKGSNWEAPDGYDRHCTSLGMLLDLDNGTLSVYQNGQRLGTLKDGLAGEYCWIAGFHVLSSGNVFIQRGYNVKFMFM